MLPKGSKIKQALEKFNFLAKDAIIFIVDSEERLLGSLTDGDVRRGLLKGFTIEHLVDDIIQQNPKFIRESDLDVMKVIEYRESNYRIIPVLNQDNRIVNIINFSETKSFLPIDAVIMAGGRGERLRPLTDTVPKPLLFIGDKPILEHTLERFKLFGIDHIWITLNYLGEKIEEFFGNGNERNVRIKYVLEEEPLGTIGSVASIRNFSHDYILVSNSDLLTNVDYEKFFLDFLNRGADFSVLTVPYRVKIPYAIIETSNENIVNFIEKPTYTYYSNGGIYIMKREILKFIEIGKYFNATDLMRVLIDNNYKVIAFPFSSYWLDIGRIEDYNKAKLEYNNINFR